MVLLYCYYGEVTLHSLHNALLLNTYKQWQIVCYFHSNSSLIQYLYSHLQEKKQGKFYSLLQLSAERENRYMLAKFLT